MLGTIAFWQFGISKSESWKKDACRKMLEIRLVNSWKSWIWNQYPWKWNGVFVFSSSNKWEQPKQQHRHTRISEQIVGKLQNSVNFAGCWRFGMVPDPPINNCDRFLNSRWPRTCAITENMKIPESPRCGCRGCVARVSSPSKKASNPSGMTFRESKPRKTKKPQTSWK